MKRSVNYMIVILFCLFSFTVLSAEEDNRYQWSINAGAYSGINNLDGSSAFNRSVFDAGLSLDDYDTGLFGSIVARDSRSDGYNSGNSLDDATVAIGWNGVNHGMNSIVDYEYVQTRDLAFIEDGQYQNPIDADYHQVFYKAFSANLEYFNSYFLIGGKVYENNDLDGGLFYLIGTNFFVEFIDSESINIDLSIGGHDGIDHHKYEVVSLTKLAVTKTFNLGYKIFVTPEFNCQINIGDRNHSLAKTDANVGVNISHIF